MDISVNIKSGTGGWADYDGCDFCVTKIAHEKFPIPRVGEVLEIFEDNDKGTTNLNGVILQELHQYLVTNIHYWVCDDDYGVTIYVVPIGRSIKA